MTPTTPAERFAALAEEHKYAARVSRQLPDAAFDALASAADECAHGGVNLDEVLLRPMAFVIETMLNSASGGHGEFSVPENAGYVLDALHTYSSIAHTTLQLPMSHQMPMSDAFRVRMNGS